MNGLAPIGAQEIIAYQQLHGIRFTGWELDMIEVFDSIAMEYAAKQGA